MSSAGEVDVDAEPTLERGRTLKLRPVVVGNRLGHRPVRRERCDGRVRDLRDGHASDEHDLCVA